MPRIYLRVLTLNADSLEHERSVTDEAALVCPLEFDSLLHFFINFAKLQPIT
jgi:hypothetical protein